MSVSLVNGHIDLEIPISTQIADLLEECYMISHDDCTWSCQKDIYDKNGKLEEHSLISDVEYIMKKNDIKQYIVEVIDVYDNPSIDCRCLCVSWIENGKLDGFNQPLFSY